MGCGMRGIIWSVVFMMLCATTGVLWAAERGAVDQRADRLVFHKFVCVAGSEVTLGDLAEGSGPDSAGYLEHFGNLHVAGAPAREGMRTVITDATLRRVLDTAGPMPGECELPFQILVQRGGRVALDREIKIVADKFLTAAVASFNGEVVIREYKLPDHIFLPDAKGRLGIEVTRDVQPGRVSFRIKVMDPKEKTLRRIACSAFVDVWATVPCAARPLNKGVILRPDLLRFERKNVAYLKEGVWHGRGGPWRVVRPLGVGEVVYENRIELLPDVVQGARVSLVYEGETIRLEVPAEALQDGRLGASIMVRNLQSGKKVLARIKDADTVVVH